jgi:hypothetical protein
VSRETELRESLNLPQLRPARWEIAAPSKLQRLQSWKTGITRQEKTPGSETWIFFSKYTTSDRFFAAALRSSDQQRRQQPLQQKEQQSSGKNTHQDTN